MADPRTFVLIGNFEDNITPALTKINNAVDGFKRNMATLSTKKGGGYNDVTQAVGKLVSAQKHLKEAIEGVGAAAKSATQDLKDYKNVMGKVASAHYHIQKSGTAAGKAQSKFWKSAEKDLEDYKRKLEALQRQTRINPYRALSPPKEGRRSGGGGAASTMMAPGGGASPRRREGGGGGGYNFHMGAFSFGMELGQGLAQPISTAIFSGFQMGVGLMAKTMEHIQTSFAERVQDQMTDLQTAGGYYAIAKRQKDPMFTSLQSAIRFTQETNLVMSRLASDLPGSTEDYVKVSKRIGDSVMRLVDQNEKGSIAYAQQLIAKGGLQEQYKNISLEGPQAREGAISVILGELTKKTVLAGFGGSTGRGGATGAYGLPAQMEKLITNPDTSLAQLQKYAAVFGDPKIMAALERAMPKLEKAGANMLERAKIVNGMLDEIVPPEMIAAMRKSMAGMMEAYRSAFFDPEMGLFGFGRKIEGLLQPMVNEFGQFVKEEIDANGKKMYRVVKTADEASQITLGVFEQFSDIISNYGAIIKPIVDNLYLLWDPLKGLATVLKDVRTISTQLLDLFRTYDDALKQEVEALEAEGKKGLAKQLGMTRSLRSSLLTLFDIFTDLGAFSEEDFSKYRAMIIDPTKGVKDLTNLVKTAVTTFFDSTAGFNAGKFVGEMLREVAVSLSEFTGFISQLGTTELVKGFMAGFGEEGVKAIEKIFRDIYTLLLDAIKGIIPLIPWQVYALAAAGIVIPAAVSGLAMAFAQGITEMLQRMGGAALKGLKKSGKGNKVAEVVSKVAQDATDIAQGVERTTRKVRVTGGGKGPKGAPVTQSGGRGTSGRYIRSIREGTVTKSGRGITRSGDAAIGSAKVTQSLPEPVKPSKLKNFLKSTVGAGDEFKSVFGERFVKGARGAKDLLTGDTSFRAFAKGLPVRIVSVAKKATTAAKGGAAAAKAGGLAGLLSGAKGAAGGLKGLFGKGITGLGKFGGIATAGVGIFEAIMALLSGDSLGQALGKGAGPVIGTIIGTALLGPIGGVIGSWIGSMESITGPLGSAFESIMGTLGTLGGLIVQVGSDISGVFASMFGLGKEFSLLAYLINAVLSPFRLLEIAIIGIYEMYLRLKPFKTREEQAKLDELYLLRMQKTASEEIKWRAGMNRKFLEERKKELESLEAEGRGNTDRAKQLGFMIEEITKTLKDKGDKKRKVGEKSTLNGLEVAWTGSEWKPTGKPGALNAPKPSAPVAPKAFTKPFKPKDINAAITALGGDPNAALNIPKLTTTKPVGGISSRTPEPGRLSLLGDLPKTSEQNTKNTTDLNRKSTEQIKRVGEVRTATERTTTAVKQLTAKITAQTSVQTTVAAIYNLLASGSLRVNGMMNLPGGAPGILPPLEFPSRKTEIPSNLLFNFNGNPLPQPPTPGLTLLRPVSNAYPSTSLGDTQVASLYTQGNGGAGGGGTFGDINVTVNAGAINDPDKVATLVANKLSEAVADARAASIFV